MKSIEDDLSANIIIGQLPIGEGSNFEGVIDIVDLKSYRWSINQDNNDGTNFQRNALTKDSGEEWEHALIMREKMIETLGDLYDEVANLWLNKYLEQSDKFPSSILQKYLKAATLANKAVPVFCGSASNNIGIQPLLDAVVDYLPSPDEMKNSRLNNFPKDLLIAYAFKVVHDKGNPLVFTRLYSGDLVANSTIYNLTKNKYEKDIKLFRVFANEYQTKKTLHAGHIVAIAGLMDTGTGDVLLGDKKDLKQVHDIFGEHEETGDHEILSPVAVHEPVFFCTIEAQSLTQQKALDRALEIICKEDPSVHAYTDHEFGQKIVSGMGELHVEVILERLTKEFKLNCYIGPLKVAYREHPLKAIQVTDMYKREISNKRHEIEITIEILPVNNYRKIKVLVKPELKSALRKHIETGIKQTATYGAIMGFPVVGANVVVHKISMNTDSPQAVVTTAASTIMKRALLKADSVLLEPIMKLEIVTPSKYLDIALNSLSQRRADVQDVATDNLECTIQSTAPVAEMLGYANVLRTKTSGNADLSMHVHGYRELHGDDIEILRKKQI